MGARNDLFPISRFPWGCGVTLQFPWLQIFYRRPIPYFHRLTPSSGSPLAFHVHWRVPQRHNPFHLVSQFLIQYLGVPMIVEGAGASHHNLPGLHFHIWPQMHSRPLEMTTHLNSYPKSPLNSIFGYTSPTCNNFLKYSK